MQSMLLIRIFKDKLREYLDRFKSSQLVLNYTMYIDIIFKIITDKSFLNYFAGYDILFVSILF